MKNIVLAAFLLPVLVPPAFAVSSKEKRQIEEIVAKIKGGDYEAGSPELLKLGRKAGPFIEPLTEDENPGVRRNAVFCLAAIDHNLVPNLIKQFYKKGLDNMTRSMYFQLLCAHRTEEAKRFLLRVLKDVRINNSIRAEALGPLSLYRGDKEVLSELLVFHELGGPLRREALYSLGVLGSAEAIEPLRRSLADPDQKIRMATIHALAGIGGKKSAEAVSGMLKDEDGEVRGLAMRALGVMRSKEHIPDLEKAAGSEADPELKWLSGAMIEKIRGSKSARNSEAFSRLNVRDLLWVDELCHPREYADMVEKLRRLKKEDWILVLREADDVVSLTESSDPEEMEASGWLFMAFFRPLAMIDEGHAMKVLASALTDRTYSFTIRSTALDDDGIDEEIIRKVMSDPAESPRFRALAESRLASSGPRE